jgi:parvulin-like peptidyl-prolyl isomerase
VKPGPALLPAVASAALAAAALAAPAGDEAEARRLLLARVNGEEVTLDDLREAFRDRHGGHGSLLAGRDILRSFLDSVIEERLLAQEAFRMGLDQEPELRRAVEAQRDLLLLEVLEDRWIRRPAEPADEEIRGAHARLGRQVHVAVIEVGDAAAAKEALARLQAGEEFDAVARALSIHRSRARGGDLGWIGWGTLDAATEKVALETPPGQVSPAFAAGAGHRILRIFDERAVEAPPFERAAPHIRAILRARREREIRAGLLEEIRRRRPPREDAAALSAFLERDAGADDAVLLRTAGGLEVKAGQVRRRAAASSLSREEAWRAAADDALLIDEARRRLKLDPERRRRLERAAGRLVLAAFENEVLRRELKLDEAEVRALYDRDPQAFAPPPSYHLRHILLASEEEAREVRRELEAGADFAELARRRSLDRATAEAGGDLGWVEAPARRSDSPVAALPEGGLSEPLEAPGGYAIVQVVAVRHSEPPLFEQARDRAAARLAAERVQARREEYLVRLREVAAVEVFERRLEEAARLQEAANRRKLGAAALDGAGGER